MPQFPELDGLRISTLSNGWENAICRLGPGLPSWSVNRWFDGAPVLDEPAAARRPLEVPHR